MSLFKLGKQACKIIIAGITAVALLSLILCAYCILPVHVDNPVGNTDYVWEPNAVWVKMIEGISCGRFDANGYNNAEVINSPDILIVGSSHMEATNVMQDQNTASILAEKLGNRFSIYNVGISGHDLAKVCQYLEKNIQVYGENLKTIIIETSSVSVTQKMLEQIMSGTVARTESHSTGLIGILQKLPFCRLLYQQMVGGLWEVFMPSNSVSADQVEQALDKSAYTGLFSYLSELEAEYGVQLIIFYHPTGALMEDGSISFPSDEALTLFSENAATYGINFIDMTDAFEEMYYSEHHVAHGFVNTKLEAGHLNKYGHAAIASALYDEINAMEEAGLICK